MGKLVLLSILVATVTLPAIAARQPNASRGLRTTGLMLVVFGFLYWAGVQFLTPAV